jgi:hypothetical protein
MTVFTVHQPAPRRNEITADPDRTVFVRDGFYFWAFLLGPLWMLWRRLWLVLVIYLVLTAAIQAGLWALGVSGPVRFAVGVLIAILVGFEAGTLRRWSLRRRFTNVGLVVAPNQEIAEHRFFESWSADGAAPAPPPVSAAPPLPSARMPESATDIIGLFPEPQPRP